MKNTPKKIMFFNVRPRCTFSPYIMIDCAASGEVTAVQMPI